MWVCHSLGADLVLYRGMTSSVSSHLRLSSLKWLSIKLNVLGQTSDWLTAQAGPPHRTGRNWVCALLVDSCMLCPQHDAGHMMLGTWDAWAHDAGHMMSDHMMLGTWCWTHDVWSHDAGHMMHGHMILDIWRMDTLYTRCLWAQLSLLWKLRPYTKISTENT